MARDLGYRRNQWPTGVTLIRLDGRDAALRIRPSGVGLRTDVPDLGDDPVGMVTGLLWIAFGVLAAPFLAVGGVRRVRAAGRLRKDLRATIADSGRTE